MRFKTSIWVMIFLGIAIRIYAWEDSPLDSTVLSSATGASATAYTSMLAKADVALARNIVSGTTALKGSFGEAIVGSSYLSKHLANTGNWVSISPRIGPNGIDHVFLKVDPNNWLPRSIIVGESKYNTSNLGHTKDGIQLGSKWTAPRLRGLGNRYLRLSNVSQCAPRPDLKPTYDLTVTLKNGKTVYFWKANSLDSWKADCSPTELSEAKKLAINYGKFLNAAGEGKIVYRSRLFEIKPNGDNLTIIIKDASNLDEVGSAGKLKVTGKIHLQGVLKDRLQEDIRQNIAKDLRKKIPGLADKDIDHLSRNLTKQVSVGETLKPYNNLAIAKGMAAHAGIAALAVSAINIGMQFIFGDEINYGETSLAGGAAFTGAMTSQGIQMALMRAPWMAHLGNHLNCSAQLLNSMASSAMGSIIFSGIYALGGWYLGYMDATTARRSAIAGIGGSIAGPAAGVGTLALVSAYGTASTGTPIAILSGAAATNAKLAALGCGAVSAGGGGMATGVAVLSGITIFATVGVTVAIIVSYKLYDAKQETKRITALCDKIDDQKIWEASWKNSQATLLIPAL